MGYAGRPTIPGRSPNVYMEICVDCGEPFKNTYQVHRLSNTDCYWCQRGIDKPLSRLIEDRELYDKGY